MPLEAKIEELSRSVTLLTGDVQLLTAALKPFLEHLQKPVLGSNIVFSPVQSNADQALIREREKEIVKEEMKGGLTHEEYQQPEPETSPYTYDDVKRATNALSAAKGKKVTIAALAHFGVTRATQLTEAQWGDYVAHCKKAAA